MKKVILILSVVALIVSSCEKENELEDSTLGYNPYENPVLPFVTVEQSTTLRTDSTIAIFDLIVHLDRIPDNIDMRFVQQGIIDPFGDTVVTAKVKGIYLNKKKREPTTYKIGLFDVENKRISALAEYTHY
jgi:hypothetical protein